MSELFDEIFAAAQEMIDGMTQHDNRDYVDRRAFTTFWVDDAKSTIAIDATRLDSARYYGGFEYIDDEYVVHFGSYVFYSADDGRIQRILDQI